MIPFYLICAFGSSGDLKVFYPRLFEYRTLYIFDLVALAAFMWACLLLSILLAVLFFLRHQMFRPLMIYFSLLPPVLLVGTIIHSTRFPSTHHTHAAANPYAPWVGLGLTLAILVWPFYYWLSPRVRRVFNR